MIVSVKENPVSPFQVLMSCRRGPAAGAYPSRRQVLVPWSVCSTPINVMSAERIEIFDRICVRHVPDYPMTTLSSCP